MDNYVPPPLTPTSSRLPPGIAQAAHPQWSVLVQRLFTQVALMRRTGPHPHSSYLNMCFSDVWRTCTTDRTAFLVFKVTPVQDPFHSLWVKGVSEFKVRTLTWQLVILADVLTFRHLRGKLWPLFCFFFVCRDVFEKILPHVLFSKVILTDLCIYLPNIFSSSAHTVSVLHKHRFIYNALLLITK